MSYLVVSLMLGVVGAVGLLGYWFGLREGYDRGSLGAERRAERIAASHDHSHMADASRWTP